MVHLNRANAAFTCDIVPHMSVNAQAWAGVEELFYRNHPKYCLKCPIKPAEGPIRHRLFADPCLGAASYRESSLGLMGIHTSSTMALSEFRV